MEIWCIGFVFSMPMREGNRVLAEHFLAVHDARTSGASCNVLDGNVQKRILQCLRFVLTPTETSL